MKQHDLEMVVLALLTIADFSGYSLERLSRQTLGADDLQGAAVFCTIRRLIKREHVAYYHSSTDNKLVYSSTKEGRAYLTAKLDGLGYHTKHIAAVN